MIKKGYTLIEVVIVIAILTIIISIAGTSYKNLSAYNEALCTTVLKYEITDALSYAKVHCNNIEKEGFIILNNKNGIFKVKFICSEEIIFNKEINAEALLFNENKRTVTNERKIKINYLGVIESTSIYIKLNNEEFMITISTGSDDINCKEVSYD